MIRVRWIGSASIVSLTLSSCGGGGEAAPQAPDTITLRSPAFAPGGPIPKTHSCDGDELSPPLEWGQVPGNTKSLVLLVEDPDAPGGIFTHWIVYNLTPATASLPQGVRHDDPNVPQGRNDFGELGYGGPCPPKGTHHYVFRLYALDALLNLGRSDPPDRAALLRAMRGHALARAELVGTFAR
jgi:Raf kinase inhibitor-like YbhB/YbcL family protein